MSNVPRRLHAAFFMLTSEPASARAQAGFWRQEYVVLPPSATGLQQCFTRSRRSKDHRPSWQAMFLSDRTYDTVKYQVDRRLAEGGVTLVTVVVRVKPGDVLATYLAVKPSTPYYVINQVKTELARRGISY